MEDAFEELRSAAEDEDADRLMEVFAEMNDYRIPGSRTKLWEALSEASENGDYEEILKLLCRDSGAHGFREPGASDGGV